MLVLYIQVAEICLKIVVHRLDLVMNFKNFGEWLKAYLWYDDNALSTARSLVQRLGKERAIAESWARVAREQKGRAGESMQVYRAVIDITKPEMLYHM